MAKKIQGNYDALSQMAQEFCREAEASKDLTQQVRHVVDELMQGGWVGVGAQTFFSEMQDLVLPGMDRLFNGLNEASQVLQRIIALFRNAEAEAARYIQPYTFNADDRSPAGRSADLADDALQRTNIAGMGVIADTVGVLSQIFPGLESTHTAIQKHIMNLRTNLAHDLMADIPGLDPTAWGQMNQNQRLAVLQQVQGAYASAFGMGTGKVSVANVGQGGAESDGTNIRLDPSVVQDNDVRKVVSIFVEEARHNLQIHAVTTPGNYSYIPESSINTWRANFSNYILTGHPKPGGGTYTWNDYRNQPVEVDGWNAGGAAASELYTDK
jgi:WXG100 family type VII secretion target